MERRLPRTGLVQAGIPHGLVKILFHSQYGRLPAEFSLAGSLAVFNPHFLRTPKRSQDLPIIPHNTSQAKKKQKIHVLITRIITLQQANRDLVNPSKPKTNDNHCEKRKVPSRIDRRLLGLHSGRGLEVKIPSRPPLKWSPSRKTRKLYGHDRFRKTRRNANGS